LLNRAKAVAAKFGTSIDALCNVGLLRLVETGEMAYVRDEPCFAALLDFSLGRIDDLTALERLGLASDEDLFLRMAEAHLPMPRLSDLATRSMVRSLAELPR
jgi:hypothetical protein